MFIRNNTKYWNIFPPTIFDHHPQSACPSPTPFDGWWLMLMATHTHTSQRKLIFILDYIYNVLVLGLTLRCLSKSSLIVYSLSGFNFSKITLRFIHTSSPFHCHIHTIIYGFVCCAALPSCCFLCCFVRWFACFIEELYNYNCECICVSVCVYGYMMCSDGWDSLLIF